MIDLHCHSNYSDGLLSPELLLQKALNSNIKMLALTDHDTVEGVAKIIKASQNQPIEIISGIELSAKWKKYDIHILGLKIDLENERLNSIIKQHQINRINRAQQIGARLETIGIQDAYDKASIIANHSSIGRPHFAKLLLDEGKVTEFQQAFNKYLGKSKIAYVASLWVSLEEIVSTIKEAGGYPVIAHPFKYSLTRTKIHELIKAFKEAGGMGLEVVSGLMQGAQIHELAMLAKRYDLLASTGSDYHGDKVSLISLGRQQKLPVDCRPIWQQW